MGGLVRLITWLITRLIATSMKLTTKTSFKHINKITHIQYDWLIDYTYIFTNDWGLFITNNITN